MSYKLHDLSAEREWQHLPWFQYQCFIWCNTPRNVDKNKQVKTIAVPWAENRKGYTNMFSAQVISKLQLVQVQSKVAIICQTSDYIIRSIMEDSVKKSLDKRGYIKGLEHISIDEKAYTQGHEYATILTDAKQGKVLEVLETQQ